MKRFYLLFFCFASLSEHVISQTNESLALLPSVLPASPEAASFAKFGTFPVNLYAGLPDISIPLYNIKVGELDVPISISYHASGIKVSDWGSWVGLGWNLNAGGMVSRKIMGKPDDGPGGYMNGQTVRISSSINTTTQGDLDYLRSIYHGDIDCEPDIYSYSFPGKNGKFLYNQLTGFSPIVIPYDPIIISRNSDLFDITDERGVGYQFHDGEYTTSSAAGAVTQGMSSWVLTKMTSANQQDAITFLYAQRFGQVSQDFTDLTVVNDLPTNIASSAPIDLGSNYNFTTFVSTNERKIQEIDFLNGKVIFDPSTTDRLDGFTGQKSLNDIKVYSYDPASGTFKLLKQINFYQSYFLATPDNSTRGLRLDSIGITDNNGLVIEKYRFTYNAQQLPRKDSRARDYWGYYNGKANNILVPPMQIPYQSDAAHNTTINIGSNVVNGRDADSTYMQAGMLKRIYYPTGGYSEFTYQTNRYTDVQNNMFYGGGLRIKSIANYDGINTLPTIKSYAYGTNESGTGRANFILNNYFFQTIQTNRFISYTLQHGVNVPVLQWLRRQRTYCSNPSIDIEPYDGSLVVYSTVTEYVGDGTSNGGKTVYYFTDVPDGISQSFATNHPVVRTYHINRGQLSKKEDYINKGSGLYQIANSFVNTYEAFPETNYSNVGLVVFKSTVTDDTNGTDIAECPQGSGCPNDDSYSYIYANYDARSDDNRLVQSVKTEYDQNDIAKYIQTWTHFYYDNFAHQQVTREYTVNSLGDTIKLIKKYPHDFSSIAPYNSMILKNNINKVVQAQKLDNSTQLTLQTNNYLDKGNGNYLTDNITYQIAANPVETRASFNGYDVRGNIIEMQKTNDVKQSVIWDYQKVFPIALVMNAPQNQIAYTSFEADNLGNWSTGDPTRSPESLTGNQAFILNSGNSLSYYFSSAGFNFILSYWSKDGPVTVNGVSLVNTITGPTKNGWTYYEHTILANTGNGMSLTASSAKTIDELRLYPATAQMTTYTYSPLVGRTSECSTNNTVTYYIYDSFNRLKAIRDVNGNILKTYEYKYQTGLVN